MTLQEQADAIIFRAMKSVVIHRAACPWCPDFNPRDLVNKGASHGMCLRCSARLHAEMDAR